MQGTYPRSCALTETTEAISGPTTSDARPAAAAAPSAAAIRAAAAEAEADAAYEYGDDEARLRSEGRRRALRGAPRASPAASCCAEAMPCSSAVLSLLIQMPSVMKA